MTKEPIALFLGCFLWTFFPSAYADVYKCSDAKGRTVFSDAPCISGGEKIQTSPNGAGVNIQRDIDSRPLQPNANQTTNPTVSANKIRKPDPKIQEAIQQLDEREAGLNEELQNSAKGAGTGDISKIIAFKAKRAATVIELQSIQERRRALLSRQ